MGTNYWSKPFAGPHLPAPTPVTTCPWLPLLSPTSVVSLQQPCEAAVWAGLALGIAEQDSENKQGWYQELNFDIAVPLVVWIPALGIKKWPQCWPPSKMRLCNHIGVVTLTLASCMQLNHIKGSLPRHDLLGTCWCGWNIFKKTFSGPQVNKQRSIFHAKLPLWCSKQHV